MSLGTLALSTASSSADPSAGPAIPTRSSSTRQKQPRDAKRSRKELEADIKSLSDDIGRKAKKLKLSTSYDSDFWTTNADISRLCQQRAGMESRPQFESRLQFLDIRMLTARRYGVSPPVPRL